MKPQERVALGVLFSICLCHCINDLLQSLLSATYPTIKSQFHLSFTEIGVATLAYQLTASLLQPAVGFVADRRPAPFSLPLGTLFTFAGLWILSAAQTYGVLVLGACVLGVGSSVFHPEASRVARMAAGHRPGFAQSVFQVGGTVGTALGPLGAATIVARWGQRSLGWFSALALVSTCILSAVGIWYKRHGILRLAASHDRGMMTPAGARLTKAHVTFSITVLLVLTFSKFVYLASFGNYYTFYLMNRFDLSIKSAQLHLFLLSLSVATGLLAGGSVGDRIGRRKVIMFSILGVLPFALALPYASLFWTEVLTVLIGLILASAFPAIVVYGQELIPGSLGMVSGLFFGLSFGAAGLGAGLLGNLADATDIQHVYRVCAFLPALGVLAVLLPDLSGRPVMQLATSGASDVAGTSRNRSPKTWRRLGPNRWGSARRLSGRGAAGDR
jgi:FSR family fosmidomycin resistance protein-like MFS transporter